MPWPSSVPVALVWMEANGLSEFPFNLGAPHVPSSVHGTLIKLSGCGRECTVCVCRSNDNSGKSVLCFLHVGPKDCTKTVRFSWPVLLFRPKNCKCHHGMNAGGTLTLGSVRQEAKLRTQPGYAMRLCPKKPSRQTDRQTKAPIHDTELFLSHHIMSKGLIICVYMYEYVCGVHV